MRIAWILMIVLAGGCDSGGAESKDDKAAEGKSEESLGAFSKYKRKSIASEAKVMVKKMADGARMAYEEENFAAGAMVVAAKKLPESAPMTPEAGTCCKLPDGKCPPDGARFGHPSWKAMMFDIADPHYYSYEFVAKEDGFTARAVGDLDCDGTFSTFEIAGKIENGEITLGSLKVENELE